MKSRVKIEACFILLLLTLPIVFVWHTELIFSMHGVSCDDMGLMSNGLWSADACTVFHFWMYLLVGVNVLAALDRFRRLARSKR